MTLLLSREAAGLRPARSTPARINPRHLTAHYGGPSPWRGGRFDHDRCASIWRSWQAYHMNGNGWSDIAYSSAVCPHGVRFEGRGPGRRTAANGTNEGNRLSLATVYLAGDDDPLTDGAKLGFLAEAQRFGVPLNRVHSDWKATSCPGDPLRAWVRAGAPSPGGAVAPQPLPTLPPVIDTQPEEDSAMYFLIAKTADGDQHYVVDGDVAVWMEPKSALYAAVHSPGTRTVTLDVPTARKLLTTKTIVRV